LSIDLYLDGIDMNQIFIDAMVDIVGKENILLEECMANHTTFRIGGAAQLFAVPHTIQEIQAIQKLCNSEKEELFVLGFIV